MKRAISESSWVRMRVIRAQPTERLLPLSIDEVDEERRIHCRHYDLCLDHADRSRWTSWSCWNCPVEDELTVEERRTEGQRVLRVLEDFAA